MSFYSKNTGRNFNAGYFLSGGDENCERVTGQVDDQFHLVVTRPDGTKIVPAGAVYPTNDVYAIGFVYEDTDVTDGAMPCSVVVSGSYYVDRLPETLSDNALSTLNITFKKDTSPVTTRPFPNNN